MAQMNPLRQRMIEDLTIRNLSPATQQSYIHAVSKFSRFFRRSPVQLGYEEVRAYQVHLVGRRSTALIKASYARSDSWVNEELQTSQIGLWNLR
jgi:hypothetical protein